MFKPELRFDKASYQHYLTGPGPNEIRDQIAKALMQDVELKIHQTLIELGWTPPTESLAPTAGIAWNSEETKAAYGRVLDTIHELNKQHWRTIEPLVKQASELRALGSVPFVIDAGQGT